MARNQSTPLPTFTGGPVTVASATLFTIDTLNYSTISVQFTGQLTGGVQFFSSNDGVNYTATDVSSIINDTMDSDSVINAPDIFVLSNIGRYLQAQTTAAFTGSVSWNARLNNLPVSSEPQSVVNSTDNPLTVGGRDYNGNVTRAIGVDQNGGVKVAVEQQPIATGAFTAPSIDIFRIDTTGYNALSIQYSGAWVGPVIHYTSNDGINWIQIQGVSLNEDSVPIDTIYGPDLITFPSNSRYIKATTTANFVGYGNYTAQLMNTAIMSTPIRVTNTSDTPLAIGGVDQFGNIRQINVDTSGAIKTADSFGPLIYGPPPNGNYPIINSLDTTGYNTIVLQWMGAGAGNTVTGFFSNDGGLYPATANALFYSPAGGTVAATSITTPASGTMWTTPVIGRYFRLTSTLGSAGSWIVYLRSQPFNSYISLPTIANQGVSLVQVAATAIASAGTVGVLPVNGGVANAAAASGANPVMVGGTDSLTVPATPALRRLNVDGAGNLFVVPQTSVSQLGGPNTSTSVISATAAFTAGSTANSALPILGQDSANVLRRLLTDMNGKQIIAGIEQSNYTGTSVTEVLNTLLTTLRETNMLLRNLPVYMNIGVPMPDDENEFRQDPSNQIFN